MRSQIEYRIRKAKWILDIWAADLDRKRQDGTDKIALFNPAIHTCNRGDQIIEYYCLERLREIFPDREFLTFPTHTLPSRQELVSLADCGHKIVCGTNLMTSYYERFSNWKMPHDLKGYRGILTMGVGWGSYTDLISRTSRFVYRTILSKKGLHSVRDSYTERKFREMGIRNVVNTGCPTLWDLTEERCCRIPAEKADRVITTITDYDRAPEEDKKMLVLLRQMYSEVFLWIQGTEDLNYLKELGEEGNLNLITDGLDTYSSILDEGNIDYVGTRLHAGIHALNRGVRTLIIGIDNRAIEMARDFQLPMIERSPDTEPLENWIGDSMPVRITLPLENIQKWKQQFKEIL